MCHQIARKRETDARRNEPNQSGRDRDILWKTFTLSSKRSLSAKRVAGNPRRYAAFLQQSASSDARQRDGVAASTGDLVRIKVEAADKIKDPSGGQPDGSKPYGRLGW